MSLVRIKELEDQLARRGARIEELENGQRLAELQRTGFHNLAAELNERIATLEAEHASALRLVAEVRHAAGDDGKRMLPELVEYVAGLVKEAARYRFIRSHMDDDKDYRLYEHKKGCDYGMKQGKRLDSAIDAAMEQTKNREGA